MASGRGIRSNNHPAMSRIFLCSKGADRDASMRGPGTMGNGGEAVVSAYWLIVAFAVGGCAGVLLTALMRMAGGLPEPSAASVPDLNSVPW